MLGSAEYDALGFAPHPDFQQARAHLGQTDRTERDHVRTRRKPTYIEGPNDNPRHVLRTLRRAVGRNGFHYTVTGGIDELRATG